MAGANHPWRDAAQAIPRIVPLCIRISRSAILYTFAQSSVYAGLRLDGESNSVTLRAAGKRVAALSAGLTTTRMELVPWLPLSIPGIRLV